MKPNCYIAVRRTEGRPPLDHPLRYVTVVPYETTWIRTRSARVSPRNNVQVRWDRATTLEDPIRVRQTCRRRVPVRTVFARYAFELHSWFPPFLTNLNVMILFMVSSRCNVVDSDPGLEDRCGL